MKGLALETIIGLLIAMAGVLVFLSLVGYFRFSSTKIYCDLYSKIATIFSRQATLPQECERKISFVVEEINESDSVLFSRILLGYIISCWKKVDISEVKDSYPCYELHLLKEVNNVSEKNVTDILIREDGCISIENSDYNCGERDQIIWEIKDGLINKQKVLLIEYDADKDAIRVIG